MSFGILRRRVSKLGLMALGATISGWSWAARASAQSSPASLVMPVVEAVPGLLIAMRQVLVTGAMSDLQQMVEILAPAAKIKVAEQLVAFAVANKDVNGKRAALIAVIAFSTQTLALDAPNTAEGAKLIMQNPEALQLLMNLAPGSFAALSAASGGTNLLLVPNTFQIPSITLPSPAQIGSPN